MFQRVEVVREGESGLVRHVWTYSYYERGHALVLDSYRLERRASRRHKFQVDRFYSRFKGRYVCSDDGERLTAPPSCSSDILSEAREKFMQSLDVRLTLDKEGGKET